MLIILTGNRGDVKAYSGRGLRGNRTPDSKDKTLLIKSTRDYGYIEALKENLMHVNVQTTDSIYGVFGEKDIKEHYLGLHSTKEINLLEEIPPEDREFVLNFYRLYKDKEG